MAGRPNETEPLLHANGANQDALFDSSKDTVEFNPDGDEENPVDWPSSYKWSIVLLLAVMAFTVTFTCIGVVPVASHIVEDLNQGRPDKSASTLLVTIWELGEAAGPLLIAPFSEIFGRYRVMNGATILFVGATVMAATSKSVPFFIASRILNGLGVASNVLNPAIVGDMFIPEERGSPVSLIMLAPLLGGAVGPAVAGAITENFGWRYFIITAAVMAGGCEILFLLFFKETFRVVILRRRAAKLRKETGDQNIKTHYDLEEEDGFYKVVRSITRPMTVLFNSGVIMALALFGSVVFSYFYILSVSLPDILDGQYHLKPSAMGLSFLSFSGGSFISIFICHFTLDKIYISLRDANGGEGKPEFRLPLVIIGSVALPITVILYGWVAHFVLPLALLLFMTAMIGTALLLAFIPLMAYVVDASTLYSASAMTGVIVTRCLMGTFLPLTSGPIIEKLGYGWGFTVLACFGIAVMPIPLALWRYGNNWRQQSLYTREPQQE